MADRQFNKLKQAVRAVLPTAKVSRASFSDDFVVSFRLAHVSYAVGLSRDCVDEHTVARLTRHIKLQFGLE